MTPIYCTLERSPISRLSEEKESIWPTMLTLRFLFFPRALYWMYQVPASRIKKKNLLENWDVCEWDQYLFLILNDIFRAFWVACAAEKCLLRCTMTRQIPPPLRFLLPAHNNVQLINFTDSWAAAFFSSSLPSYIMGARGGSSRQDQSILKNYVFFTRRHVFLCIKKSCTAAPSKKRGKLTAAAEAKLAFESVSQSVSRVTFHPPPSLSGVFFRWFALVKRHPM